MCTVYGFDTDNIAFIMVIQFAPMPLDLRTGTSGRLSLGLAGRPKIISHFDPLQTMHVVNVPLNARRTRHGT